MCIQETRLHAICNHAVVERIECSDKCAHFDTIEIQLSTYCQSCRQQVDNTAILSSVLRWKLGPCPARRRKIRPVKTNLFDVAAAAAPSTPGTATTPTQHARKLSGAKSLSALREAASAPPTRELPPTPPTAKKLNAWASVGNLAASPDSTFGSRYSLDVSPTPLTPPLRRTASEAFKYVAGGDRQLRLTRAHTVPKSKARPAVPRPASRVPIQDTTPRRPEKDLRSPRASPQQVEDGSTPAPALVARDIDTAAHTTTSARPSTANTTNTTATAASISLSTNVDGPHDSALLQQTPSHPPPPSPQRDQTQKTQKTQQPLPVSTSVPRSLWSLRRNKSSARSLALASTKEYVDAKLCHGPLPSPTPGKNLFPAPKEPQRKKSVDIHDPEWLASHGLKWEAHGLGLVGTAL